MMIDLSDEFGFEIVNELFDEDVFSQLAESIPLIRLQFVFYSDQVHILENNQLTTICQPFF